MPQIRMLARPMGHQSVGASSFAQPKRFSHGTWRLLPGAATFPVGWHSHSFPPSSKTGVSAEKVEHQLLLSMFPPSALCLDPSPTVASNTALHRLNDTRFQHNRCNLRAHYNMTAKVWFDSLVFILPYQLRS
jgi:hypothetical protein